MRKSEILISGTRLFLAGFTLSAVLASCSMVSSIGTETGTSAKTRGRVIQIGNTGGLAAQLSETLGKPVVSANSLDAAQNGIDHDCVVVADLSGTLSSNDQSLLKNAAQKSRCDGFEEYNAGENERFCSFYS